MREEINTPKWEACQIVIGQTFCEFGVRTFSLFVWTRTSVTLLDRRISIISVSPSWWPSNMASQLLRRIFSSANANPTSAARAFSSVSTSIRATLFPGDGIGPEIAESVKQVCICYPRFLAIPIYLSWDREILGFISLSVLALKWYEKFLLELCNWYKLFEIIISNEADRSYVSKLEFHPVHFFILFILFSSN